MDCRKNLRIFNLKLEVMKMFYDDFEVGDTIGYDENWDGRLTGRMIEHVLTEISLNDIKTWETKDNPHNMRIIKKGMNKTTQQIIDEDFEGGLTMGQIQCKDCNDNLTHCTCIEDTVDMKQETQEYDLLQHIKFCLECKNESQAIRLIEKYGFQKQETLEDKLESLVVQWHQRQLRYEEVADDNIASEHNNRKFTYKAMATRDCWKELLTLLNESKK